MVPLPLISSLLTQVNNKSKFLDASERSKGSNALQLNSKTSNSLKHTVLTSSKWSIWHPIRKDVGAITKSSIWRDRRGTKVCCHWRGWRYNIKHSAMSVNKAQSEEKKTILCSVKIQVIIWKKKALNVYKELYLEHTRYAQIFHQLVKLSLTSCFLIATLHVCKWK